MANIIHRIGIKASIEKIYRALTTIERLSGWWTVIVEGNENVGGKICLDFSCFVLFVKKKQEKE